MSDLFAQLGIDWKLLVAQAVNFGIVAGVLAWFVFRPLLALMEKRRKRIAEGLELRDKAERELIRVGEAGKRVLGASRKEAGELLGKTRRDAVDQERTMLKEAERKAGVILSKAELQAKQLREATLGEAQEEAVRLALLAAGKILERSMDSKGEERMAREVLAELTSNA
ncbi:F0F1 ATP synthase subunit B [Patescibacteria group bacterium]|nr:F0F1 ATP synthase subunit B [Patescibacteria group bacterium]